MRPAQPACRRSISSTGSSVAGVDDLGVVEAHQRHVGDGVDEQLPDRRRVALARRPPPPTPVQSARRGSSPRRALVGREVGVAARQRQAVGLAHQRAADDRRPAGRGRRSCAGSPRAAARPCGRSRRGQAPMMENSLVTTVVTPSKCPGRLAPHSTSVRPATCTVVRAPPGYISSTVGSEEHVDALRRRDRGVAVGVARVGGEVLGRPELRGVHEQADHHEVVVGPCRAHQRPVPFVEEPHRRDEADGADRRRARRRTRRGPRRWW